MANDIRPKYWSAWGGREQTGKSGAPGGSDSAASASPTPTPSATTISSAITRSDQHDCARLRRLARSVTGTPIGGRVKDRDINLAGDANRSAHRARRSFKAKAGSRRDPSQKDVASGLAAGPPAWLLSPRGTEPFRPPAVGGVQQSNYRLIAPGRGCDKHDRNGPAQGY